MRVPLLALPLLFVAVPAAAQYAPPRPPVGAELGAVLSDPHLADRVTDTMQAMSDAMLNLPVGELEAAVEGRPATRDDHYRTLGSNVNRRELHRQIADSRGQIRAGQQAVARSIPVIAGALAQATDQISRAIENAPRPDYPRY